ncbi:ATP-dependent RNA helicase DDX43 [Trichonephila clavipes]|nr:ATP-dependent RNA helicase DDX43 [Trichonephila clavipes]
MEPYSFSFVKKIGPEKGGSSRVDSVKSYRFARYLQHFNKLQAEYTYGKLAKNAQNSGYYNDRLVDSCTTKPKDERRKNKVRVFSNSSNRSSRGGRNDNYRRSNDDSWQMEIGSNFAGRVIDRGGWKIEEFQDESDARIRVLNESDANGRTAIRIIGPAEARDKAKLLIEEFIVDFSQVSIDKSSRSNQEYEEARKKKLAALSDIKKYFYVEHPAFAAMPKADVV